MKNVYEKCETCGITRNLKIAVYCPICADPFYKNTREKEPRREGFKRGKDKKKI